VVAQLMPPLLMLSPLVSAEAYVPAQSALTANALLRPSAVACTPLSAAATSLAKWLLARSDPSAARSATPTVLRSIKL